jgi:hypothetical protein
MTDNRPDQQKKTVGGRFSFISKEDNFLVQKEELMAI